MTRFSPAILLPLTIGLSFGAIFSEPAAQAQGAGMPPAMVTTMSITPQTVTLVDELPGRVAALRSVEIRPQVGGIIEKRMFEQGSQVKENQPLFQVFAEPFQAQVNSAQAALERAEASLSLANIQLDRSKQLRDKNTISQQGYDSAEAEAKSAQASVSEAKANLNSRKINLDFTTVRSPVAGQIGASLVSEGTLVAVGQEQALAVVQQIDKVYVDLRRPASSLGKMQKVASSKPEEATVEILDVNGQPYPNKGTALFTDISVDEATGDVTMRVLVDNPDHLLLPGMFVRAVVPRATLADALLVPQQAIIRGAGGAAQVVVVGEDNLAHFKPVSLGELVKGSYVVTDGLSANDTVVIRGQTRVTKDGSPVHATPAPQTAQ